MNLPGEVPPDRPAEPPCLADLALDQVVAGMLAGRAGRAVVGNDVLGPRARTIVNTGANQGGKSTLLRALGLAQVMMQAGMAVGRPASARRGPGHTRGPGAVQRVVLVHQ